MCQDKLQFANSVYSQLHDKITGKKSRRQKRRQQKKMFNYGGNDKIYGKKVSRLYFENEWKLWHKLCVERTQMQL